MRYCIINKFRFRSYTKIASDSGFRFRLHEKFLQIEHFASDRTEISLRIADYSLHIADFASNLDYYVVREYVVRKSKQKHPLYLEGQFN